MTICKCSIAVHQESVRIRYKTRL